MSTVATVIPVQTDSRVTDDLVTVTTRRWRSRLSLTVRAADAVAAAAVCERQLVAEVDALEGLASRFRPDSQLSAVNRGAGSWIPVTWAFVTLLSAGLQAAERTGGIVDPCLGALVDAAGYRAWRDGKPAPNPGERSRWSPDSWQRIEVRPGIGGAQVRVPEGCELDLGAVAKAWLADHLAERLVDGWNLDVIANLGGDLRAIGLSQPWTIAADPQLDGWQSQAMTVTDAALATSGQGLRRWATTSGEIAHHIIDPRTGRPAVTPWWTASVLAADARDANTASTAAMVLGHSAPGWLAGHGLDAWLVPAPGHDRSEARFVGRWPGSTEATR